MSCGQMRSTPCEEIIGNQSLVVSQVVAWFFGVAATKVHGTYTRELSKFEEVRLDRTRIETY